MNVRVEKISVMEKVGYSLGDLAANLIFQTLVTFIAFFYTDVYGLPPAQASMVTGVCGILGGVIFAPVVGVLADRTNTRWGKFRPWVLFTSIPFGLGALLSFTTPDLDPSGKLIYAFVTYLALMMLYSANNLPYSALSGVITGNMGERVSLSSYRFVAVMVAQFIIQVLLLPLVLILGDGDKAEGFKQVMTIFAVIGVVCFIITFLTTKERVTPNVEQKSTIKEDLGDLFKNIPWVIMLLATILVFMMLSLKSGTLIYYFENYLNEAELARFLDESGFNGFIASLNAGLQNVGLTKFRWPEDAPTSAFSLFNGIGIILMIIGIGFSKPLTNRFGKRNVFGWALAVSMLFILVLYFLSPESIGLVFLSQVLHGFSYGITIPLLWAMIADVADYSEWKNNRRATGIIFSAMILGLKLGLTLGGSLVSALLAVYGYQAATAVQSQETIDGILLAVSLFASLPGFLAAGLLVFYKIDKNMEQQIESDLDGRRNEAIEAPGI
ncbi:glycoside-pentoside-hexuronide (GPH):cation symporter [Gilvimarinus sp. SDUM040013]|uniref:Glycoside-pentoside-hexuronide (GPH):cation symporter n=1 Tax=Gilvimarinus gilvus TaxID=3058038 RepID=A0ABU4S2K5_9GAMM|nr:glycoside-pentoside-hexuronide (GPH):cation symporter [Gilvimarinus sp. SDUM040013]MDO3385508.1 glycoside-pentoside-hexuronide (GPH):cation symporter [Gilvimarinus sp. SDUM040013]MDX6851414.1 glycoside-pentoside-hexuronide (GPH):cation symporter [Gilvimarinus sp. SDUM040013]